MKNFKSPLVLRVSLIISTSSWSVYCIAKKNYVGAAFNIVTAIINLVMIFIILFKKNDEVNESNENNEELVEK